MTTDDGTPLAGIDAARASADDRQRYLLRAAEASAQLWILCDDEGFVMMQSDQERCVPVWPEAALAEAWATGDWADCAPFAVDVGTWHERWTRGLTDDGIQVALFPAEDDDVVVLTPDAFAELLRTPRTH